MIWQITLGTYPKELKTGSRGDTCTSTFTVALFTMAKRGKQPRYPQMSEWVSKMWHVHTMEYYSAVKSQEIRAHTSI